jgi:hypothetical protein
VRGFFVTKNTSAAKPNGFASHELSANGDE